MKRYLFHILVALSQLGNTILGGYPDESMSARAWRTGKQGKLPGAILRPMIDAFFFVVTFGKDRNHCRDSYDSERLRRQFPNHYRG
jgi:hypothetical protein